MIPSQLNRFVREIIGGFFSQRFLRRHSNAFDAATQETVEHNGAKRVTTQTVGKPPDPWHLPALMRNTANEPEKVGLQQRKTTNSTVFPCISQYFHVFSISLQTSGQNPEAFHVAHFIIQTIRVSATKQCRVPGSQCCFAACLLSSRTWAQNKSPLPGVPGTISGHFVGLKSICSDIPYFGQPHDALNSQRVFPPHNGYHTLGYSGYGCRRDRSHRHPPSLEVSISARSSGLLWSKPERGHSLASEQK